MEATSDRGLPTILTVKVVQLRADHAELEWLLWITAVIMAHGWLTSIHPVVLPPDTLCGPDILETPLELRCLLERQGLADGVAQGLVDGGQLRLHLAVRARRVLQLLAQLGVVLAEPLVLGADVLLGPVVAVATLTTATAGVVVDAAFALLAHVGGVVVQVRGAQGGAVQSGKGRGSDIARAVVGVLAAGALHLYGAGGRVYAPEVLGQVLLAGEALAAGALAVDVGAEELLLGPSVFSVDLALVSQQTTAVCEALDLLAPLGGAYVGSLMLVHVFTGEIVSKQTKD